MESNSFNFQNINSQEQLEGAKIQSAQGIVSSDHQVDMFQGIGYGDPK